MTYPTATAALKAAVGAITGADGKTLTYTTEPRNWSLLEVDSKAAFDAHFLIRNESGPIMWQEEANDPVNWYSWITLEIGTELLRDALTQSETVEDRARLVLVALLYTATSGFCVFDWEQPEIIRIENDKRILWRWRFKMRYSTS